VFARLPFRKMGDPTKLLYFFIMPVRHKFKWSNNWYSFLTFWDFIKRISMQANPNISKTYNCHMSLHMLANRYTLRRRQQQQKCWVGTGVSTIKSNLSQCSKHLCANMHN
jgi:hypothetical protein